MPGDQFYEKVADDEGGDRGSSRMMRAPPTLAKKTPVLTKLGYLAVAATVFLIGVAAISSAMVSITLPKAVEAALAQQQINPDTPATSGAASQVVKEKTVYKLGDADAPVISYNLTTHKEFANCGSTPDEARAAGCVFDAMMQLWTPKECMDAPLSDKFLAEGNWTFYKDGNAKDAFTLEELKEGNHDVVYVVQSYYRHHCIFAWERLVRAMRNQSPLIHELMSYDWVLSCRHRTLVLPDEVDDPLDDTTHVKGVIALTGYTSCASYDVWLNGLPLDKLSSVH